MKQLYLIFSMVLLTFTATMAQKTVTGTVTDDTGEALISANVIVKGTDKGTVTEFDGTYSISVNEGDVLLFTYTGYADQEKTVGAADVYDVILSEGLILNTAVVTALGISKDEKSLGYAVQKVGGDDLIKAREANIVNSLNGRIAGVQITNSSGAVGGSSRIVLRGATSITGNNEPLFVVDGVPIDNGNYGSSSAFGGADQPNGIADINPDDIETISVLKGPNAAALYGVRAANGVVLITTKGGSKRKGVGISFNSSTTFESPLVLPDYQNSYGQGNSKDYFEWIDGTSGNGGVDESWGPPLDAGLEFVQWNSYENGGQPLPWVSQPDNIKNFYETGITTNNNISFSGGNEVANFRLGLGLMNQKGMIPNTDFRRYNITGSSSIKLAEKVTAGLKVNYIKSGSNNLPVTGYDAENPVQQMVWSGRNVDFEALKNYQNLPAAPVGTNAEGTPINWNTVYQNNPYWVLDNNLNDLDKDRLIGNVNLKYQITDWLSVTGRTGADTWSSFSSVRKAVGTNEFRNGYYGEVSRKRIEINSDIIASFNKNLTEDFSLALNFGGASMVRNYSAISAAAPELEIAGLYNVSNVKSGVSPTLSNFRSQQKINSLLGFGQIGYKNALYLDFSARNDWSSLLPEANNSFFYPAVSVSAVLTELIEMPNQISFLKLRGGWSLVGSTGALQPYGIQQNFNLRDDPWGTVLMANDPGNLNNPNIQPESTSSIEVGLDARFFNDRFGFDLTYYNQTSRDLIVPVDISPASGYTSTTLNIGEMTNKGIELQIRTTPVQVNDFKLDVDFNFARNRNEVVSLGDEIEALNLGGQWNVDVQAREGLPYGVLFGPGYLRDDSGNIIYSNGLPQIDQNLKVLGNTQPDWTGGIVLTASYKGLELSSIIDAKIGGDIYTMTTTWGRYAGVLDETLIGRETGIVGEGVMNVGTVSEPVYVPNNVVVPAKTFNQVAYSNSVAEGSVFDASYVKLRQIMLTYTLPSSLFKKTPIRGASVSFVGRNLAILHRNVPHIDPESAFSNANGDQGLEFGQLPSARSLGINLNVSF